MLLTGFHEVLLELMLERGHRMGEELQALLAGGSVLEVVIEHISLRDVQTEPNATLCVLLASGYVTACLVMPREGELHAKLAIPNEEVRYVSRRRARIWVQGSLGGSEPIRGPA